MSTEVRNNVQRSRYELFVDDLMIGLTDYNVEGDTVVFPHTEIAPSMRGKGLGEQLVRCALDDVREHGARVRAVCRFVREFIDTHPTYADLKAA